MRYCLYRKEVVRVNAEPKKDVVPSQQTEEFIIVLNTNRIIKDPQGYVAPADLAVKRQPLNALLMLNGKKKTRWLVFPELGYRGLPEHQWLEAKRRKRVEIKRFVDGKWVDYPADGT